MSMIQLVLANRPGMTLSAGDTELVERDVPEPGDGQFRVKLSHIALEVSMIGWMREGRSYLPNIAIGDPIRAMGVGIVEDSLHPGYKAGALVIGLFDAGTYAVSDGKVAVRLDATAVSPEAWAGALGLTTAFTSFVGMSFGPQDLSGNTVLVTGTSGLVGGYAAQLAKQRGARVIGTAGSEEACRAVERKYRVDYCLNYNNPRDFESSLSELCPDRIDMLYDNVGGTIFDAALGRMNAFGTIVMCGQTSERGLASPPPVTNIRTMIMERLTMRGFVVFDHPDLFADAAQWIAECVSSGALVQPHEDISHPGGLAEFHDAYTALVGDARKGKHVLCL